MVADVTLTWNGHTGTMGGWTGPDTPDGSSHLAFEREEPDLRCPCGWRHMVVGDEVRSWGLVSPPPNRRTSRPRSCRG